MPGILFITYLDVQFRMLIEIEKSLFGTDRFLRDGFCILHPIIKNGDGVIMND